MVARTEVSRLPILPSSQLCSHRSLSSQYQGRVIGASTMASVLVIFLQLVRGEKVYLAHSFIGCSPWSVDHTAFRQYNMARASRGVDRTIYP